MSSDNMTPSTIAMQEDAMWAEYRAEQQAIATAADHSQQKDTFAEEHEESGHGRFLVTGSGPAHLYPSKKQGQTTKDRRFCPKVKFSDSGKALGKTPGRKDKSYRQLKHEGCSADTD